MLRRFGSRAGLSVLTFVVAAGFYLAAPPPRAQASDCGPYSGNLCWKNEECSTFLFYKICTTKYKYYPGSVEPLK